MTANSPTLRRGVWTPRAALEELERRDRYAHLLGPDGTMPPTCPAPDPLEAIAAVHPRCPSCGAVCGVDRIRNGYPEEIHPAPGTLCPFPVAPRDRRSDEPLPVYLARVDAWYRLRAHLRPGDTVYTILRHRSASGMRRRVSLLTLPDHRDGEAWHLDYLAARALDLPCDGNGDGVTVDGAGMDMGYHLVDGLSWALYGRGYVLRHRWL